MKNKRTRRVPEGYAIVHRPSEFVVYRAVGEYDGYANWAVRVAGGFLTGGEAIEAAWAHAEGDDEK